MGIGVEPHVVVLVGSSVDVCRGPSCARCWRRRVPPALRRTSAHSCGPVERATTTSAHASCSTVSAQHRWNPTLVDRWPREDQTVSGAPK